MFQEIIEKIKPDLERTEQWLKDQILEIRIGRIPTTLIEDIKISLFGQELPLKQLGIISSYSSKEILVQLWDKSYLESVISVIEKRGLNLDLRTEENKIFLSFPPLNEETKRSLIKILNEKKEEAFQRIRHIRDRAWKELQEKCQKGEISEDDKYRGKNKLEDLIREYREKIEKAAENKKREIE